MVLKSEKATGMMRRQFLPFFLFLLFGAMLAGCDDGEENSDTTGESAAGNSDGGFASKGKGAVEGWAHLEGQSEHAGITVALDSTGLSDVTDDTGYFLINNVPPDVYTVTASLAGYEEQVSEPFAVTAGETSTIEPLTLHEADRALQGYVFLSVGTDFSDTTVKLQGTTFVTLTNKTGLWSIQDVPTSNYTVIASHDGFDDAERSDQEVIPGGLTKVPEITLQEKTATISGRINLEGTDQNGGAIVVATLKGDIAFTKEASSNVEGIYQIADLKPGIYRVEASKPGFGSEFREGVIVAAAKETSGVDFNLKVSPMGTPNRIIYISGGSNDGAPDQVGTVGQELADPFVVKVLDSFESPVADVKVDWQIEEARTEGHMVDVETYTDEEGQASNAFVLGQKVGQNHVTVRAHGVGNSNVLFSPHGRPDMPASVLLLEGGHQTGTVGSTLTSSIEVKVLDQYKNVIPNQIIEFTPSSNGKAKQQRCHCRLHDARYRTDQVLRCKYKYYVLGVF